ncbi:hypothetical protein P5G64_09845 [Serratia nevei]|uniref:hypothetical protein n=1 Tax=Serratia marcescens TaxID=615 RepID=UPI001F550E82|nr:hypothetical protein [Serratia marcescens]MDF8319151.1 hypothetical protein [Serratia nevei]MDF8324757.1 hypothetical protein [Serratia nevei]MDF8337785.1 hypothetical protein [Serratia nevei]MDF8344616.1 hypothetical protein [Serratia nevei]MDF8348815.1 hypothetical protein [Serratia nevei]
MKLGTALLLSAGIMPASLSPVNAGTPDALVQAHHQRCGKPVFYAQTVNHKKEVEICIITPSVSYSFGKTGAEHKEMDITVPAHATTYAYQSNQVISLQEFTLRNGDTTYRVSAGTNDEGKLFASLDIYKGTPEAGKRLAEIPLDPDTVVNSISHALAQEGVAESDNL